ncbi:UNVERIFIED_CONTAM: hypothetical protein FKN15_039039 [Acipenser sinensis]
MESIEELIARINRNTAAQIEQTARFERWAIDMGLAPPKTQEREPTELEWLIQVWELPPPEPRGEEPPLPEPRGEEPPLPEPRGKEPPLPEPRGEAKSIPPPQPRPPSLRSSPAPLRPVPHLLAPGHPVGWPGPPFTRPRAQESAESVTVLHLVPCSAPPGN